MSEMICSRQLLSESTGYWVTTILTFLHHWDPTKSPWRGNHTYSPVPNPRKVSELMRPLRGGGELSRGRAGEGMQRT